MNHIFRLEKKDSKLIGSFLPDHEIDVNWCPPPNRQPHFAQIASNKDANYNQNPSATNDNEPNQNAAADNQNSLVGSLSVNPNSMENARYQNSLQFDYNISQIFSPNMTINDPNRENNVQPPSISERLTEPQPRSFTSEYESIPSIENKDCEYLKLVMAFKRTLVLPDVFFSYDMAVCYCTLCLSNNGRNSLEGKVFPVSSQLDHNNIKKFQIFRLGSIQIKSHGYEC